MGNGVTELIIPQPCDRDLAIWAVSICGIILSEDLNRTDGSACLKLLLECSNLFFLQDTVSARAHPSGSVLARFYVLRLRFLSALPCESGYLWTSLTGAGG